MLGDSNMRTSGNIEVDRQAVAAQLKKLREIGKKKQEQLMEDSRKRQAVYFGET